MFVCPSNTELYTCRGTELQRNHRIDNWFDRLEPYHRFERLFDLPRPPFLGHSQGGVVRAVITHLCGKGWILNKGLME